MLAVDGGARRNVARRKIFAEVQRQATDTTMMIEDLNSGSRTNFSKRIELVRSYL